jgi:hypothetical protein
MGITTKIYESPFHWFGKWVLVWQSAAMAAPVFWYYDSREAAEKAARLLLDGTVLPAYARQAHRQPRNGIRLEPKP